MRAEIAERRAHDSTQVRSTGTAERQLLAAGGASSLAGLVVGAAAGFVFVLLVGRMLGASQSGALLEAIALTNIVAATTILGADTGLLRLLPRFRSEGREALRAILLSAVVPPVLLSVGAAGLGYVYASTISNFVVRLGAQASNASDIRILCALLPFSVLMTIFAAGLRSWSVGLAVIVQYFIVAGLRPLIIVVALWLGATPKFAAVAYGVTAVAGCVVATILLYAKLVQESSAVESERMLRRTIAFDFWKFSGPRAFGSLFEILLLWLDVVLVGAMSSSSQAAAYAVASRYVVIGTFALQAVHISVSPQFGRLLERKDFSTIRSLYRTGTIWSVLICWPILFLLGIFAPVFMSLFGSGFEVGATALTVLSIGMCLFAAAGPSGIAVLMISGPRVNAMVAFAALISDIIIDVALIPHLSALGAALGWLVSLAVTVVGTGVALHHYGGANPFSRAYARALLGVLSCFGFFPAIAALFLGRTWTGLMVATAVGMWAYWLFLKRHWSRFALDEVVAFIPRKLRFTRSPARRSPSLRIHRTYERSVGRVLESQRWGRRTGAVAVLTAVTIWLLALVQESVAPAPPNSSGATAATTAGFPKILTAGIQLYTKRPFQVALILWVVIPIGIGLYLTRRHRVLLRASTSYRRLVAVLGLIAATVMVFDVIAAGGHFSLHQFAASVTPWVFIVAALPVGVEIGRRRIQHSRAVNLLLGYALIELVVGLLSRRSYPGISGRFTFFDEATPALLACILVVRLYAHLDGFRDRLPRALTVAFCSVTLLLANRRNPILVAGILIIVYPVITGRWKSTALVLATLLMAFVVGISLHVGVFDATLNRIGSGIRSLTQGGGADSSVYHHLADITLGFDAARGHPLFGIGPFASQLPGAAVSSNSTLYLHNDALMMWLRYGMPGLVAFVCLLVGGAGLGIWVIAQSRHHVMRLDWLCAACFPIAVLIGGVFAPYITESRRWDGLFGVALGVCVSAITELRRGDVQTATETYDQEHSAGAAARREVSAQTL